MLNRRGVVLGLVFASSVGTSTMALAAGDDSEFFTVGVVGLVSDERGAYELQIGEQAWTIDRAGYQLVESEEPLSVTVWRTDGCQRLLRFRASPETGFARNTIDLGSGSGGVTFERTGSDGVPTRPISRHPHAPTCALPDTATTPSAGAGTIDAGRVALLVLVAIGSLAAASHRLRTRRRRSAVPAQRLVRRSRRM